MVKNSNTKKTGGAEAKAKTASNEKEQPASRSSKQTALSADDA